MSSCELGTLSQNKPQLSLNLVFSEDDKQMQFELEGIIRKVDQFDNQIGQGRVDLLGYLIPTAQANDDEDEDDEEEDEIEGFFGF